MRIKNKTQISTVASFDPTKPKVNVTARMADSLKIGLTHLIESANQPAYKRGGTVTTGDLEKFRKNLANDRIKLSNVKKLTTPPS
jgi:hypothetical protein